MCNKMAFSDWEIRGLINPLDVFYAPIASSRASPKAPECPLFCALGRHSRHNRNIMVRTLPSPCYRERARANTRLAFASARVSIARSRTPLTSRVPHPPQADTEEPVAAPVVEEIKPHMPNPRQGEHVFGVAHIFASFNDTFVVRIPSTAANTGTTRRFSGIQTLDEDFP